MLPPPLPRTSTIQPARPSRSALAMAPCTAFAKAVASAALPLKAPTRTYATVGGSARCVRVRRDTGSSRSDGSARHRPVKTMAITEHLERRAYRRKGLLHGLRGPSRRHDAGSEDVPIDLRSIEGMLLHDRDQLGQIRARGRRQGPARRVWRARVSLPRHTAATHTAISASVARRADGRKRDLRAATA